MSRVVITSLENYINSQKEILSSLERKKTDLENAFIAKKTELSQKGERALATMTEEDKASFKALLAKTIG